MDINEIIAVLHLERQNIDQAIAALQHVGGKKRRGRPPKWMTQRFSEKRLPSTRRKKAIESGQRNRELTPSGSPN
jgi:hypothetical protein